MKLALELTDVAIRFGGVQAVDGVTVAFPEGDFVGLIGPNGAGKTTLIRIIIGILKPDRGKVVLADHDVTREPTAARIRKGLALTHQIVRPFRRMTVLDNVALAAGHARTSNPLKALLHADASGEKDKARELLRKVGLAGTEDRLAGELPLGQMKRLEVARALALEPRVILLDEPLAGLNQGEAARQVETIAAVNASGITVILVEHNLQEVMRNCRRLVVLNNGQLIADGEPRVVISDPQVQEAYVGSKAPAHAQA